MKTRALLCAISVSLFCIGVRIAAGELSWTGAQSPFEPPQLLRARDYLTSSLGTLGMAVDADGNVYVPSPALHVIYKISPGNEVTIVAGTGTAGFTGSGGPAVQAQLDAPTSVSMDSKRNLYVADRNSRMLQKITPDGNIQDVVIAPVVTLALDSADLLFMGLAPEGPLSPAIPVLPVKVAPLIRNPPQFGRTPFGILALSEGLLSMAYDGANNMYVADPDNSRVLQISPDAVLRNFAGTGKDGDGADGDFANKTPLFRPNAVAVDREGNVYIAEAMRSRIRKVTLDGTIHTIDGPGVKGPGDVTAGEPVALGFPRALAVDSAGNLYVADTDNPGLRKISPDGRITIMAAGVSLIPSVTNFSARQPSVALPSPSPGLPAIAPYAPASPSLNSATTALISSAPAAILPNALQMLRGPVTSADGSRLSTSLLDGPAITEESPTGRTRIVFKTPSPAPAGYIAPRRLNIQAVAIPASVRERGIQGRLELDFVVDESGGVVDPVVTWGMDCELDDAVVLAIQKSRFEPARTNGKPQKTAASATVEFRIDRTLMQAPQAPPDLPGLSVPAGIAVDNAGNLYIATPTYSRIHAVTTGGAHPIAGSGIHGLSGNGLSAIEAELRAPMDVAADSQGNVYIADTGNSQIRAVVNGLMIGVAGRGTSGFGGDRGPALCAQMNQPSGVAVDRDGAIYIADTGNDRIRKALPNGEMRTLAGTTVPGFNGDGKSASSAQLKHPMDVAVDSAGNVYVADTGNHRIRQIRADGTIRTIAGTGRAGFGGDGASGIAARLNDPRAIAVDGAGNVYIADTGNNRIRKWSAADGAIRTIAGTGELGARGDGGPAVAGQLRGPTGVAVDASGVVYIADTGNGLIRRISADGILTTVVNRIP